MFDHKISTPFLWWGLVMKLISSMHLFPFRILNNIIDGWGVCLYFTILLDTMAKVFISEKKTHLKKGYKSFDKKIVTRYQLRQKPPSVWVGLHIPVRSTAVGPFCFIIKLISSK